MHAAAVKHEALVNSHRTGDDAAVAKARRGAGSRGLALLGLLRDAWVEYERDRAHYLAMAIIYYAGISVVPLLLLLLSTLGLALRFSETAGEIQQRMQATIEAQFGPQLSGVVTNLLDGAQRDSVVATIVSVIGILISASLLLRQLRLTFRAVWHFEPPLVAGPLHVRVFTLVREWVIAFLITLGGGGLLLVALVVISAFKWIDRLLVDVSIFPFLAGVTAALSSFVLATITFGALLKVLPPQAVRWRDIWLAILLCAGVWVGATELLPLYNHFFGENRSAYSVIGALLPLLISINIASQMLFYGAELSKVVTKRNATPLAITAKTTRAPSRGHRP